MVEMEPEVGEMAGPEAGREARAQCGRVMTVSDPPGPGRADGVAGQTHIGELGGEVTVGGVEDAEQQVGGADPVGAGVARLLLRVDFLTLCGLLSGSMTDPPALAFANAMAPDSEAQSLAYATVYPLVMGLRILSPQILALVLTAL